MIKKHILIGGMTCLNCRDKIENKLKNTAGIKSVEVSYEGSIASIVWDNSIISYTQIKEIIEKLGYAALEDGKKANKNIIWTFVTIFLLYILLQRFGINSLASSFPLAQAGINYGMLFIIGIITSLHCIAMCGGINISQCIKSPKDGAAQKQNPRLNILLPSMLYNGGRLFSYTIIGIIAGSIGSVINISGSLQGIAQIFAGIFMIFMGLKMLELIPALRRFNFAMPKIFIKKLDGKKAGGKSPLIVGLLNGLMPCGPLQAMQIYALSTGSPIAGGISMFLFGLGTIPLMFSVGALSSFFNNKFTHKASKIGAVLITAMGMTVSVYGLNLSGFSFDFIHNICSAINPFSSKQESAVKELPIIENGFQIINSTLSSGRYPQITVRRGIPVKWTISAPQGSINGCNNRMIIREYSIKHRFTEGDNTIEFMPDKSGRFIYSCWMGMIRSYITVIDETQNGAEYASGKDESLNFVSAGVIIPTDKIVSAKIDKDGYQTLTINLLDDSIEPSVIILKRNVPARLLIKNYSRDSGNSRLNFPVYFTQLDINYGENIIEFSANEDFVFSTWDNIFYVYVKIVDDLKNFPLAEIKKEVEDFETKIYPDDYFKKGASAIRVLSKR